jgi:hypothetical protein
VGELIAIKLLGGVLADRGTDVVHTMRNATDGRISNPLKYQLFLKLA